MENELPKFDHISTTTSHLYFMSGSYRVEKERKPTTRQPATHEEKTADVPHNQMVKYNGLHYVKWEGIL